MSAAEIEQVRLMFQAFMARDIERLLSLLAAEIQFTAHGTAELAGRTGPYEGREGMREYMADVERLWDELTVLPEDYRAVAGSVIIFGRVHGRRGDYEVHTPVIWTWRLREGRIVSGSVFPTPEHPDGGEPAARQPAGDLEPPV